MADTPQNIAEKALRIEVRNILQKLNDGHTLTSSQRRILAEYGGDVGRVDGVARYNVSGLNIITQYDRRTLGKVLGGMGGEYTIRELIDAFRAYERGNKLNIDPVYERARKDKEQADKTALENQVRRGELLEVEDVKRIWTDHIASTKSALRAIPSKLAPVVAAETDPNVVNEILLDGVDEALEEMGAE